MENVSRFNLEQEIMHCWSLDTDLDLLIEAVCDTDMSKDELANILIGFKHIHKMRMSKLFSTFNLKVNDGTIT